MPFHEERKIQIHLAYAIWQKDFTNKCTKVIKIGNNLKLLKKCLTVSALVFK